MATRLIRLRTIKEEKIDRSRSWIWNEIAAGRFPKPVADGLWDAAEVDAFVVTYLEQAKQRAAAEQNGGKKVAKALAARAQRGEGSAANTVRAVARRAARRPARALE
jgi:predicted DNA-binding transcriptional regulator AlpA